MNWITNNNYTIKRKFNQIKNPLKNYNQPFKNERKNAVVPAENRKTFGINNNTINVSIGNLNKNNNDNNNYLYNNMYYQINCSDDLLKKLKTAENLVNNNLNSKYILSELAEF